MGAPEPDEGASAYLARARHRSTQLIRPTHHHAGPRHLAHRSSQPHPAGNKTRSAALYLLHWDSEVTSKTGQARQNCLEKSGTRSPRDPRDPRSPSTRDKPPPTAFDRRPAPAFRCTSGNPLCAHLCHAPRFLWLAARCRIFGSRSGSWASHPSWPSSNAG
jgi:hypothetical protein